MLASDFTEPMRQAARRRRMMMAVAVLVVFALVLRWGPELAGLGRQRGWLFPDGVGAGRQATAESAESAEAVGSVALGETGDRSVGGQAHGPAGSWRGGSAGDPSGASPNGAAGPIGATGSHDATSDRRAAEPVAGAASTFHTVEAESWLAAIAAEAGLALVLGPQIQGEIREAVPAGGERPGWQARLNAATEVRGWQYSVRDALLRVWGRDGPLGRMLSAQRQAERDAEGRAAELAREEARSKAAELAARPGPLPQTEIVPLAHGRAEEIAEALRPAAGVRDASVGFSPTRNELLVTGSAEARAALRAVAAGLDRPRRRVLLDARILELSDSARRELGVQWQAGGALAGAVDLAAATTPGEAAAALVSVGGSNGLEARLGALEADGRIRVVSRPSVVMLDGTPATIESVRILRIRLPDRSPVLGEESVVRADSSRATEEVPVGVRLEVEPVVLPGDRIRLRIRAKSSSLGPPLPPDGIPEELSRVVEAEVVVSTTETAVLGGLLREGESTSATGVPLLRNLPVMGKLFGKQSREADREELMVLIRPTLLDPGGA